MGMQHHRVPRRLAWVAVIVAASGAFGGDLFTPLSTRELPPAVLHASVAGITRATATQTHPNLSRVPVTTPSPTSTSNAVPAGARCPQWWDRARHAGWDDVTLLRLDVVMYRESRCRPDVVNDDDPNGGSRGLLQINGSWTRWLRERGILQGRDELFDPDVNMTAALAIYRYGIERYDFGWGPWGYRYKDPYPTTK